MFSSPKRQSISALMVGLGIITNAVTPLVITNSALAQSMFYDVQGHWAKSCITHLANQGIINGYPDGSFRPNLSMNRAEFATIVGNAFPKAARTRKSTKFVDVPVYYWAYSQVTQASQTQFLSGYPGRVFKPNQNIFRSQVLVALASGLNYAPTREVTKTLNANFTDANAIPVYAQKKIAAATEKRLVVNYPNVKFLNPNKKATRAEVAAFLCQALVNYGKASVIPEQYIAGNTSFPTARKFLKNR
jgi:hypothetical protein